MNNISTTVPFLVMSRKLFKKRFLIVLNLILKGLITLFKDFPFAGVCFAITLLGFFISTNLYSQNISVELSVEWQINNIKFSQKEYSIDSLKDAPYLCITYRNNTNSDIYCLKLFNEVTKFPLLGDGILRGLSKYNIFDYNFADKNFGVYIYDSEFRGGSWEVTSDTSKIPLQTEKRINGILGDFYDYAREMSEFSTDFIVPYHFSSEDVTSYSIAKNSYNDFVFLKKNKSYTEKFNLLGFCLLGGNYTFYVKDQAFPNYVLGEEYWNVKEQSWVYQEIPLPLIVNGFNLYAGSFNTNSVSVKFKGYPKNK